MTDIVAVVVPANEARSWWPTIGHWLNDIGDRSPDLWSGATILRSVELGQRILMVMWDRETKEAVAVAVCIIEVSDLGMKSITAVAATGHDRLDWQDALADCMTRAGRELGCRRIVAIARPGWSRSLRHIGKTTHVLIEAPIDLNGPIIGQEMPRVEKEIA